MAIVTTDRLNIFWKEGILPLKTAIKDIEENGVNGGIAAVSEQESNAIETKEDGIYVDGTVLSRLSVSPNSKLLFDGREIQGSGGGGSSSVVFRILNRDEWTTKTVLQGSSDTLNLTWSCTENGDVTGKGTMTFKVNGEIKYRTSLDQGDFTIPINADYLRLGENELRITILDLYGNERTLALTMVAVSLYITSTFDDSQLYSDKIQFSYTLMGTAQKLVHFVLDGTEIGTQSWPDSNRTHTFEIPVQEYGSHTFQVYFTAVLDGVTVYSNYLNYEFISIAGTPTGTIVSSDFVETSVPQYQTIQIPYLVYDPTTLNANVEISVNGTVVSNLTVSRAKQIYTYRVIDTGETTIVISSGNASKTIEFTVVDSGMDIYAEEDQLRLYLTSYGRDNNESHPDRWQDTDNNVSCTLTGFNYINDGWVSDNDGITVLRIGMGDRVSIPYKIFGTDFKQNGCTIELEFATRQILDVTSTIMECMNNGIGIHATPQKITLSSQQSEISMLYKEDEHVRISFVIEKVAKDNGESRLIHCYVNGIDSGVVQYPTTDNFEQSVPQNFVIGSDDCVVDVYNIRVYSNDLGTHQIVGNWIADTQVLDDMVDRYQRNDIYDDYGQISMEKLPDYLPYMILHSKAGELLPQFKGDKKSISVDFIDKANPERNWTCPKMEANVQGTSSQYYARKNYKLKAKANFVDSEGNEFSKWAMNENAIATKTFCFKADVASSEKANNIELARLYDDLIRNVDANNTYSYLTPPQRNNSKIRQAVDGFPIAMFWDDGVNTSFLGLGNFNNDKGTHEVFGFNDEDESWETKNNVSLRVIFKSDDFESTYINTDGEEVASWLQDFESRYPEEIDVPVLDSQGNPVIGEDGKTVTETVMYTDYTNFKPIFTWLKSTDTTQATNEALSEPITYGKTEKDRQTFTHDTAEYRLRKFKEELTNYFELNAILFFYCFTETFLMVDNRAKNTFWTHMGNSKYFSLPYDFDTAIGINNEGELAFGYSLEDIDYVEGSEYVQFVKATGTYNPSINYYHSNTVESLVDTSDFIEGVTDVSPYYVQETTSTAEVFNGQQSVLWNNLRNAFFPEIRSMYQAMRTNNKFSYAAVEKRFEDHQKVWCENMFNEDGIFKYIDPLINGAQDPDDPSKTKKTSTYLKMLQGSKAEQRKWWLWNRFKYMDSKYLADASNIIDMRGYAKGNITVIPYTDIYPTVKFGSYVAQERGAANRPCTLICMADNLNDTEVQIFSASQIKEVSDLTRLKIGRCDFSKATKLQNITIHDDIYPNNTLNHIALGNNELLQTIVCKNAPNLKEAIDLSHCPSLKNVNFADTGITGIVLADGSTIETLRIPDTITTISFVSNLNLSDLTIGGFSIDSSFKENNFTILVVSTDTLYGKEITVTNTADTTITATTTFENFGEKNNVIFIVSEIGEYTIECFGESTSITIDSLNDIEYNTTIDGNIAYIDFMADFGSTLLQRVETTRYTGTAVYTEETPVTSRYETGQYTFLGWNTERRATAPLKNAVGNEVVNPRNHMVLYPVIIGNDEFTTENFKVVADSGKMNSLGLLTENRIINFIHDGLLQLEGIKYIHKDSNGTSWTDYDTITNINNAKSQWVVSNSVGSGSDEDNQAFNIIDDVTANTISSVGKGIYIGYEATGAEYNKFGNMLYINNINNRNENQLYSYNNSTLPHDSLHASFIWDVTETKEIAITDLQNATTETTLTKKVDFSEYDQLVKEIRGVEGYIDNTTYELPYNKDGKTMTASYEDDYLTITYLGDWSQDSITLEVEAKLYPPVDNMSSEEILEKAAKISWSTGTDYELKKMVDWNDEGILDLYDYWNVGDKRNVPMVESRTGCFTETEETQKEMTGVFVLVHQGSKTLTDGGTNKFVVNMDNLLLSTRGISTSYAGSTAKTWMDSDDGFISMLPEIFASIFKRFTATNTAGGNVDVRFVYPTTSELYNTYTYYTQNTANRRKYVGNDPTAFGRYRCRNSRSSGHDTIYPNGSNSDYAYNSTACYITAEGVI